MYKTSDLTGHHKYSNIALKTFYHEQDYILGYSGDKYTIFDLTDEILNSDYYKHTFCPKCGEQVKLRTASDRGRAYNIEASCNCTIAWGSVHTNGGRIRMDESKKEAKDNWKEKVGYTF